MKKVLCFSLFALAACLIAFNVTIKKQQPLGFKPITLLNIQAIQASAGEWKCDQSNTACCSYPGMNSNGVLSYTN
jgi:hypothetical protein